MTTLLVCFAIFIAVTLTCIRRQANSIQRLKEENYLQSKLIEEMTIEENLEGMNRNMTMLVEDVRTIKRGLYGDAQNNVPGLIQRQERDEQRIDKLEHNLSNINKQKVDIKKVSMWATGAGAAITTIAHYLKDLFK